MANTLNLGKVTDFVTSVERVSGTGEAGSTDTYRMKTESGFTKDFNIVNGKDGISGLTYRKLLFGACTGGSVLTENDSWIIRDIMIGIGEDLLTRGYKYEDVPSSDNTPATYLFVASGKDITYMTTDIQLDMWFGDSFAISDESRDHSWKTFKIGDWATGEIDYSIDGIQNVTGDLLKTQYAYNVYLYVLEPSKVSQKVQDFVDVASDQTITGQKTFTAHIKNDEIDNTNGNAMVRYKSTENKVVLGGSTIPTTIMGSGERPTYSNNGSDFDGKPLMLQDDSITFSSQIWQNMGLSSFDEAPDNTRIILATMPSSTYCPIFLLNEGESLSTQSYIQTFTVASNSKLQRLYLVEANYGNSCMYERSYYNGTWYGWALVGNPHMEATAWTAEQLTDLVPRYRRFNGSKIKLALFATFNFSNGVNGAYNDIILGNDIIIEGNSTSKLYCNYTGGDTSVENNYSILRKDQSVAGGFTLRNVNIEAYNIRYCVHDENSGASDIYHNNYINCNMKIDNSGKTSTNPEKGWYYQCIGGGLGKNGDILITGCKFTAINSNTPDSDMADVSYHNYGGTSADVGRSHITINGNYLRNTIRLSWYGEETAVTTMIASNNSVAKALIHRAEVSSATVENTELLQWNNVIRSGE